MKWFAMLCSAREYRTHAFTLEVSGYARTPTNSINDCKGAIP